ncbi:hypothetical protein HanIR_Chr01g0031391 [Helianthus annuus]|nr:hypothetical protein HanIR_Chr01g0031391 [Helianthus annuus]
MLVCDFTHSDFMIGFISSRVCSSQNTQIDAKINQPYVQIDTVDINSHEY